MPDDSTEWLTICDAAFRLNVSWRIVSRIADAKRIPCQERSGIRFVRVDDVREWLAERETKSAARSVAENQSPQMD